MADILLCKICGNTGKDFMGQNCTCNVSPQWAAEEIVALRQGIGKLRVENRDLKESQSDLKKLIADFVDEMGEAGQRVSLDLGKRIGATQSGEEL